MRRGRVYYKDYFAGFLTETNEGEYVFQYDGNYIVNHKQDFVTFIMPVREQSYVEKRLFSFFDGLIPDGLVLDIACEKWGINRNDRMGLLLACCHDCFGAVSVEPLPVVIDE